MEKSSRSKDKFICLVEFCLHDDDDDDDDDDDIIWCGGGSACLRICPRFSFDIFLFFYFFGGGYGGRKRGRETSMWERHTDRLPLTCPQMGTWTATQACALTGN